MWLIIINYWQERVCVHNIIHTARLSITFASNFQTSKTPLQEAIDNEHIEVTKLLMKALTKVNKKVETPTGTLCPT